VTKNSRILEEGLASVKGVNIRAADSDAPHPDPSFSRERVGERLRDRCEASRFFKSDRGLFQNGRRMGKLSTLNVQP